MAVPNVPTHRTDRARGRKRRVAQGVFVRGPRGDERIGITWSDSAGEHEEWLGWLKCDRHRDGLTVRDATAEREKRRVDARSGRSVAPSRITLARHAAENYFPHLAERVAAGERSERTLAHYRQLWRSHIEPVLGRARVQEIGRAHLMKLKRETAKKGGSSLVSGVFDVLGSMLQYASDLEIVAGVPRLSRSQKPKRRNARPFRVLTRAEIERLLDHALPTYRVLLATAAYSGLRLSELLALRWNDIDFAAGEIHVRHQLSRATREKPARLVPLKTEAGLRDVALAPPLARILEQHCKNSTSLFVFATETGRPLYCRNVSERGIGKAADRAGLNPDGVPRLTMHDLRHTFASHLIRSGADVYTVSRQLGHSRASITLDLYAGEFDKAQNAKALRERLTLAFGD